MSTSRDFGFAARSYAAVEHPQALYQEIEPYNSGKLQVSKVHSVYFEECGNPAGKPVVFVHGGPGGATNMTSRRFFNPQVYRIVLFHQRGCGLSTPHANLRDNTTWHLVADMEKLRHHLGIDRWMVFGGSWGSTLALAYAQKHPAVVTEMVLRGIFLVRQREIDWMYEDGGASRIFPDAWEGFLAPIPESERGHMLPAYRKRLMSSNRKVRVEAARAWSLWEGHISSLYHSEDAEAHFGEDDFAVAFARIENHYFANNGFLRNDSQLLDDVHRIRHIPCRIVQGRYDVVCPMESAWALHRAWPEAQLIVAPDTGHSAQEPGITAALVAATDHFAGSAAG